jgi:hypothetical protein
MDLNVTSEQYGSISVFDFISWFILLLTIRSFFYWKTKKNVYYFLLVVISILLFIGTIKSNFIQNSIFNFFKFFSIFIYSKILIDECQKNPDFIKLLIKYLKLGVIISLLLLFIQIISGKTITFYPDINPNVYLDSLIRYPSFFQDPQKYAQYLSMLAFLFLITKDKKQTPEILNILVFILILLAILITGSRSAFLGMCCGALIIIFSMNNKIRFIAVFCCLLGYFLIINFSEYFSFFNRTDDFKNSVETRERIWKEDEEIFLANPILGIGIGNYHNYIVKHSTGGYYMINNEVVYYGTESGYLQILIEFGLLGFIIFLLFIIIPITKAFQSNIHEFNVIIMIASVISWMIAFTTVNSLSDKRILIVLGTLLCLLVISKTRPASIHV